MSRRLVAIIAYGFSGLALGVPFLNAAGADIQNTASISALNISWTAVLIAAVWLVSGFVTFIDRHETPLSCALHSCGIPGIFLAVLAFL